MEKFLNYTMNVYNLELVRKMRCETKCYPYT